MPVRPMEFCYEADDFFAALIKIKAAISDFNKRSDPTLKDLILKHTQVEKDRVSFNCERFTLVTTHAQKDIEWLQMLPHDLRDYVADSVSFSDKHIKYTGGPILVRLISA